MSLFERLGLPPPDPSMLEAIGRGEFRPRRPGGMDPRLARAIARAKVPTTPDEHDRMWERYWQYEQRNAARAAAKEASATAVAAAKTAEAQPRARQRQHQSRRSTGCASPSSEDGPEPSAPGRAPDTTPPLVSCPDCGADAISPAPTCYRERPPAPHALDQAALHALQLLDNNAKFPRTTKHPGDGDPVGVRSTTRAESDHRAPPRALRPFVSALADLLAADLLGRKS